MEYKFWVYIVASRSGTLYIGMTNESFDEVQKAINREKQLKGWTRARKIALIQSINPRWADLAEKWGAQIAFAGESIKNR